MTSPSLVRSQALSAWVARSRATANGMSLLCCDLLGGATAEAIDAFIANTNEPPTDVADLARLYAFTGRMDEAAREMQRAFDGADDREVTAWAASSIFPRTWGVRLRHADDANRLLAAAEGEFWVGDVAAARASLRAAIDSVTAARARADGTALNALGASITSGFVVRRIVRGALAVGADQTAEDLLPLTETPGLPISIIKGMIAADIAARGGGAYRTRALRVVEDAFAGDPGSSLHIAEVGVDAARAAGAGDVARAIARAAADACGPQIEGTGSPMFRATYAAALAGILYRAGAMDEGDRWLAITLDEDARMQRKRVRSGPQTTVGISLLRAVVAARRYDAARSLATRKDLIDYELARLVSAAARDPEGEETVAWASQLPAPHGPKALDAVLANARLDALPAVNEWGCLDSALLAPSRRPPARMDGPLTIAPVVVPVASNAPIVPADIDVAIDALRKDADTPAEVDDLDTTLWKAVSLIVSSPQDVSHHDVLRHFYASRIVQWEVGNGGFSQAAHNCLEWFVDAAAGYDAMGLPDCAALIRRVIPAATVEHAVLHGLEAPDVDDRDFPASFDDFDDETSRVEWEAVDHSVAYVRAHRDEFIASLDQLRGNAERRTGCA